MPYTVQKRRRKKCPNGYSKKILSSGKKVCVSNGKSKRYKKRKTKSGLTIKRYPTRSKIICSASTGKCVRIYKAPCGGLICPPKLIIPILKVRKIRYKIAAISTCPRLVKVYSAIM